MPTSGIPTFPYTANQREDVLDVLERNKRVLPLVHLARPSVNAHRRSCSQPSHHYLCCEAMEDRRSVLRIYETAGSLKSLNTENHRFEFGEEHPRLSFSQSTSEMPDGKWRLVFAIISNTLLLGFPTGQEERFKSLRLDQLVNTRRWREHISEIAEDLKQTMSWVCRIAPVMSFYGIFTDVLFQDIRSSHVRKLSLTHA